MNKLKYLALFSTLVLLAATAMLMEFGDSSEESEPIARESRASTEGATNELLSSRSSEIGGSRRPLLTANSRSTDQDDVESDSGLVDAEISPEGILSPVSFDEELSLLTIDDRDYIESLNERFFGALDYRSLAEKEWKARKGYPTVEDFLRARDMTFQELNEWAESGDAVGKLLLFERQLADWIDFRRANDISSLSRTETSQNYPEYDELLRNLELGRREILGTYSPFAAYLNALIDSVNYGEVFSHSAVIGAVLAGDFQAFRQVESVMESLQPQVVVNTEGTVFYAYDSAAVDAVMSFLRAGIQAHHCPISER